MNRFFRFAIIVALLCSGRVSFSAAPGLQAIDLRCENMVDPSGVDFAQPRLSWKLRSEARGDRQTAYQIIAASSAELLARDQSDLWDSGVVKSDESLRVYFKGLPRQTAPLTANDFSKLRRKALAEWERVMRCREVHWKVRVWDQHQKVSAWSSPAIFTKAWLDSGVGDARWIGGLETNTATTLLRREFKVRAGLKRALINICGLGQYELTVNGVKAGADILSPGWTDYSKTCLYDTRDLTSLLRPGANVIGIELANGMYSVPGGRYVKFKGSFGPRKAIAVLQLENVDGTQQHIITDRQWKLDNGPSTFSCVYGGEDYDARLVQKGWDAPGFDDSHWKPATEIDARSGQLKGLSAAAPPLKAFETYAPKTITPVTNGVSVYDFGQNAPFMATLKVKGPAGSVVRIIPAELIKPSGFVERRSSGGGQAYWQYTLRGAKEAVEGEKSDSEEWSSKFFYHGSRYFQVELQPASEGGAWPVIERLDGVVVHSSSEPVGEFACSNELFNRIHTLVRWAQRANLVSVLTDCPHRERLGWLEQYHLNGPSLRYEFDLAQLFTKAMNDMADAQLPNGLVPNIAPEYVVFGPAAWDKTGAFRDSPEWGSAFILVPWQQYEFTGDLDLLRRHYEQMKRYVAYLGSRATNHIVSHGLGDWYDIGPKPPGFAQLTPIALTATAFYQHDTWILAQVAKLLGQKADAKLYSKQAEEIRRAFNKKFFNPTNQTYATGSQCANAIPLVMNLCEPQQRDAVLNALVTDVQQRGLTAGDVGYRYLLRALADGGRSDVIFEMNNQSEKPGYGYQLQQGATSLTEAWDARRSSSQNHFMLGQIIEWFYGDLAGIKVDPGSSGFKNVLIKPQPVGDITWVKTSYQSARGKIITHWENGDREFRLHLTIPPGMTATVYLPAASIKQVQEGGRPLTKAPGIKSVRHSGNQVIMEACSGVFEFTSSR